MAGSRTEKHTAVYRNVKRCEFHNIGSYIVATSIIGGTTFCAFFDSGLHTEESIKRRGSIKLHSIYGRNADNGHYHGTQLKEWHGIIYLRIGR